MRKLAPLVIAVTLLIAVPASAELCTIDAVPAATLLLPYFEVDLDDPWGANTLFSVNNASPVPTVAHVTLWGDFSQPSIDFDIFLTGYDVQTVNLRDVFNGILPITSHAFNDDDDIISPHGGAFSNNPQWDSQPDDIMNSRFPGCDTILPFPEEELSEFFLTRLRSGHTGGPLSAGGDQCIGQDHGDNIARGYITIDNVEDCNLLFPGQTGYFDGGIDSKVNQLWGDYFIVHEVGARAMGDNLVHIEASEDAFVPGDYTFYGRYVDGLATDQREPLASTWASRYLNGGLFDGGSDLLVWRDSKCQVQTNGFTCGTDPPWYPLNETQVVAFNESEDAVELCGVVGGQSGVSPAIPGIDQTCFPLETQRTRVGEGTVAPPFDFGWMFLNLNQTLATGSCTTDGIFGDISQSWVTTNLDADGARLSVGYAATQLSSACSPANPIVDGDLHPFDP